MALPRSRRAPWYLEITHGIAMSDLLTRLLAEHDVLLADGALGTNLFEMGLQTGDAPELWNLQHPDRIAALAQRFIDAGAQIVLTNSFGGNRHRLKLHQSQDQVQTLNVAAAQILRKLVAQADRDIVVAGSMGPTGEILGPNGALTFDGAVDAFREQAKALQAGGVDVLWVETMSSEEEVRAACIAAHETGLPVVYTLSIDTNGRTMMGVTAADVVRLSAELSGMACACGANCGVGAAEVVAAILNMQAAADRLGIEPVLIARANCGVPTYVDGKIVYNGTPELMARYACLARDAGARIIGGCCGSTPTHIAAMRDALRDHAPGARPDAAALVAALGEISQGARAQLGGDLRVEAGSVSGKAARRSRRARRH